MKRSQIKLFSSHWVTYIEGLDWFISDAGIEYIEIARDGDGNRAAITIPSITNLLVLDGRPQSPCGNRLLALCIPFGNISAGRSRQGEMIAHRVLLYDHQTR